MMNHRKTIHEPTEVRKVMPISEIAPSRQIEINQASSILSDPDGRWAAGREEAISDAFGKAWASRVPTAAGTTVSSRDGQDLDSPEMSAGKLSDKSDQTRRAEWERTPT